MSDHEQALLKHPDIARTFTDDVYDKYEMVKILGKGSMGFVAKVKVKDEKLGGSSFERWTGGCFGLCRQKEKTGQLTEKSKEHVYALKSIITDRVSATFIKEMENEIDILRQLDHPNIVRVYEIYKYNIRIYMVLTLCDGGDLYARQPYSEREAAKITTQLLSAIKYMHARNIAHRDLKFENCMFESKAENARIKLIDFGLSTKYVHGKKMTSRVGTLYTMSPQVLQRVYTSQADMWAIGVMTFMLLSMTRPFYHKNREILIDKIMRVDYSFVGPVWDHKSDYTKDFIRKLLVMDPKERMTADQALKHVWIVKRKRLPSERILDDVAVKVGPQLEKYAETSDLKKVALHLIAHRSSASEIRELRKVFVAIDKDRDGILTLDEFEEALESEGFSKADAETIYTGIDTYKTGHIDYTEFLAATIEAQGMIAEDRIAVAFDRLDSDDTGFISARNVMGIMGGDCRKEDAEAIINEWTGGNGDGRISYEQFLDAFRSKIQKEADEMAEGSEAASDVSHELLGTETKIPGGKD